MAVAAAARTLADDLRAAMSGPPLRGPGTRRRRRRAAPTAAAAGDGDGAQTDVPECPCPADSPTAPAADGAGRRARRVRGRRGGRSPTAAAVPLDASSDPAARDETRTAATRSSWESLDAVVLRDVFAAPLPTMRDVPRFLASSVRRAFVHALRGLHSPNPAAGITAEQPWKLFLLVPRLLLTRTRETGPAGRTAANPLRLKAAELGEALRTAKRGSAAGLSGASVEHYRMLLEDEEALDLLAHAAYLLANADAPADVLRALALSRLTALSKPGGGVRGIATGDTLCRLVSRTLARRYAETFDRATRPLQFALQAGAGTDCLAAMLRAASELDADATIRRQERLRHGVPRCLPYEAA